MAYRIRYAEERKRSARLPVWAARAVMAAVLLVCLLGVRALPGGTESLTQIFLPKSGTTMEEMTRMLGRSGSAREAVVVFCRQILEDTGYVKGPD